MGFRNRTVGYELDANQIVTPVNSVYTITASQDQSSLISSRTGFRMRVYSLAVTSGSLVAQSLQRLIFQSVGAATSALTGSLQVPTAGLVLPYHPNGWFQTASGAGLFFSTTMGCGSLQIQAACIPV